MPAFTLPEMLVVIIVSGILFVAMFDGVDLVKRYTKRLAGEMLTGETLPDSFRQLDFLFQASDSVRVENGGFCFYWQGERQAVVEFRDSLLLSTRLERLDTLFRNVAGVRSVPERLRTWLADSLYVNVTDRGKQWCLSFGLVKRIEQETELAVKELENKYNRNDDETE